MHPVTTQVPSTCTIRVRLWSGEKPTWQEGLFASHLQSQWQGVVLSGKPSAPCCLEEPPGREKPCAPPALTPQRVMTGRCRGGEISQPSSVSQAFGRRPPAPEHL